MSRYVIEMRIPIVVETDNPDDLVVKRTRLRATALLMGWDPVFLTSEEWRYRAQFERPKPHLESRGIPEAEHRGKINPNREKRMAQ